MDEAKQPNRLEVQISADYEAWGSGKQEALVALAKDAVKMADPIIEVCNITRGTMGNEYYRRRRRLPNGSSYIEGICHSNWPWPKVYSDGYTALRMRGKFGSLF